MAEQIRSYRLPPLDRGGVLLGLSAAQCMVLGLGLAASVALSMRGHLAIALVPVASACGLAWGRAGGEPLLERAPVALAWAMSGRSPIGGRPENELSPGVVVPRQWGRLELSEVGTGATAMGVVLDHRHGTATAALAVRGGSFATAEADDQHRLLAGWGRALAGFCRERSAVVRVSVLARSGPSATASGSAADTDVRVGPPPEVSPVHADYAELLAQECSARGTNDVLVTVTVSARGLRTSRSFQRSALMDALGEQVRLLSGRLAEAGLSPDRPLDGPSLREDLARRLRPPVPSPARSLAEALAAAPPVMEAEWSSAQVGGASHACYWISGWPRSDVGPTWCEALLAPLGGKRVVSLIFEPVAPSVSRRRIERDATRLSSDSEQRRRAGFRIGFGDVRLADEVAEREAELGAGHAEVGVVGVLVLSAPNPEELAGRCADEEHAAAGAGLELRRLDGRHHLAFAWSLPLGLAPARPGLG